jgi:hypothetical protein
MGGVGIVVGVDGVVVVEGGRGAAVSRVVDVDVVACGWQPWEW